ncbi:glycosyltransferase family 2 protein [Romeria aff. gracilis LEGE 07310]|uniref:Glycosyltransferase family 2 protein n=1 Tax=Vasconcelosia minhoensis LEGE 07310 TaxID=915328 RepID=A0A8J7DBF1_9CYAN|nr:glycosyltransferase family A protein [Romeria gracilis]MBE9076328.1 glycosyltransferase family 2 protein [Romeria aff. gracilis LEGE 07310]
MHITSSALIAVIVPVYNDPKRLRICLEALDKQTLSKERYEILVVDNNSSQSIEDVVKNFRQAVLCHEKRPGSYSARNKGISLTKARLLAFTDSDCVPESDWLEKGLHYLLSAPNCGFVAGGIDFFFNKPNKPNPIELYDSLFYLQQKIYVEEQGWGATANLFTHKHIFEKVGFFNANLKSGGDAEWGRRVTAAGYTAVYAEDCCVFHPARSSLKELRKKIRRTLGGVLDIDCISQNDQILEAFSRKGNLLSHLRPPLRSSFRKSFQNQSLHSQHQKIIIFMMVFFLHYLKAFEVYQLQSEKLTFR